MLQSFTAEVFGRVQGVAFRYHTMKQARSIGVKGIVRNRSTGTVYLEATGEDGALNKLASWLEIGPSSATVTRVAIHWSDEILDYDSFDIVY